MKKQIKNLLIVVISLTSLFLTTNAWCVLDKQKVINLRKRFYDTSKTDIETAKKLERRVKILINEGDIDGIYELVIHASRSSFRPYLAILLNEVIPNFFINLFFQVIPSEAFRTKLFEGLLEDGINDNNLEDIIAFLTELNEWLRINSDSKTTNFDYSERLSLSLIYKLYLEYIELFKKEMIKYFFNKYLKRNPTPYEERILLQRYDLDYLEDGTLNMIRNANELDMMENTRVTPSQNWILEELRTLSNENEEGLSENQFILTQGYLDFVEMTSRYYELYGRSRQISTFNSWCDHATSQAKL